MSTLFINWRSKLMKLSKKITKIMMNTIQMLLSDEIKLKVGNQQILTNESLISLRVKIVLKAFLKSSLRPMESKTSMAIQYLKLGSKCFNNMKKMARIFKLSLQ